MTITSQEELGMTQQRIAELEASLSAARRRLASQPKSLSALLSADEHLLRELQDEVREFLGLSVEREAAYEIRFAADDAIVGVASMSMLEKVVVNFRGALTAIAECLSTGKTRDAGRPPVDIARLVDFQIVGLAPGSVRLLLEPPLQRGLPDVDLASQSFVVLEDAAAWIDSGGQEPPGTLADPGLRTLALKQVYRLAPTEWDQISWLEFSGPRKRATGRVRLTPATSHRAVSLLEQPPGQAIEVVGRLREIDLDKTAFEVQLGDSGHRRMKCKMPAELMAEALGYIAAQTLVVVRGRKIGKTLHVASLRPADQARTVPTG
jgi:hypothetical protein